MIRESAFKRLPNDSSLANEFDAVGVVKKDVASTEREIRKVFAKVNRDSDNLTKVYFSVCAYVEWAEVGESGRVRMFASTGKAALHFDEPLVQSYPLPP
jgi:hypothetical protein